MEVGSFQQYDGFPTIKTNHKGNKLSLISYQEYRKLSVYCQVNWLILWARTLEKVLAFLLLKYLLQHQINTNQTRRRKINYEVYEEMYWRDRGAEETKRKYFPKSLEILRELF